MTDIVERLEILRHEEGYELAEEAATEIRRLREQCEVMREARDALMAELKLWDMLVDDEGGCPRYSVQRGAALNSVVTSTKALLRLTAYRASEKG